MNAQAPVLRLNRIPGIEMLTVQSAGAAASWAPGFGQLSSGSDASTSTATQNSCDHPKAVSQPASPSLAKGQLWQVNGAYIEIVDLGKRLVHYKALKQKGQKTCTRIIKCKAFEGFLRSNAAALVR